MIKITQRFVIIFFLSLMFTAPVNAVQTKYFNKSKTLSFSISAQELTHIIVKGDRIQTVRGNEGTYLTNADSQKGTVFIKPTSFYQDKPFSVFLTTDAGRTIPLLLKPSKIPAETLIIQPRTFTSTDLIRKEKSEPYVQTIMQFIQAMANKKDLDDVTVVNTHKDLIKKSTVLKIVLIKQYVSDSYVGEVIEITNLTHEIASIPLSLFLTPLTKAVAWQSSTLLPGEVQKLYRVNRHDF